MSMCVYCINFISKKCKGVFENPEMFLCENFEREVDEQKSKDID